MKMICIGDSLTYGFGVPVDDNWTTILNQESIFQVVNKGISGDTSGGILARLERDVLAVHSDTVFLMCGANDFIMGCDSSVVKANLMAIIHQLRAERITVILSSGISCDAAHIRPEWAELADFIRVNKKLKEMATWYDSFCSAFQIPYINLHDMFHQKMNGRDSMYLFDGIHPNKAGHRLIADCLLDAGIREGVL